LRILKAFEFFNEIPFKVTNCATPPQVDPKTRKTSLSWGVAGSPFWLVFDFWA
jgi:hypothetical protein